uniref:Nidogen 2 n=1 Tax=Poecilia formosa TaxID=48698 RepID=A0A087XDF4_POEFO
VTAIRRTDLFPFGDLNGDLILPEGDDETSRALTLPRPFYFFDSPFSQLYVATNGIVSAQDLPMEKQYVDDGLPTDFPVVAPFLADIDTSGGRGNIYYRVTETPSILNRFAQEVHRGFPDAKFTPTHAVVATWENVAAYEEQARANGATNKVNTFQTVIGYDETDSYVLFLYPEDGLNFYGTRPKESYNVEIEFPARVGFSRGEVSFFIISKTDGPFYSVAQDENSVKRLSQVGNTGVPGVWLFHTGKRFSFQEIIPASIGGRLSSHRSEVFICSLSKDSTTPEYEFDDYNFEPESQEEVDAAGSPDSPNPRSEDSDRQLSYSREDVPLTLDPVERQYAPPGFPLTVPEGGTQRVEEQQPQVTSLSLTFIIDFTSSVILLIALTEQIKVVFICLIKLVTVLVYLSADLLTIIQLFYCIRSISDDAKLQISVLEGEKVLDVYPPLRSNLPLSPGGHVVSVDEDDVDFDTGVIQYTTENKETCARFQQQCSQNAFCSDYPTGFCCHCQPGFYGNGRHCLPDGAPQRVSGKVSGTVTVGSTPVELNNIDLHAYIVVADGRAYTAISEVPEPVGWAMMSVSPVGELFGWLFALELPNGQAGFKITGAEFTRHAEVVFSPGNQRLSITQTGRGLDEHNHLTVDTVISGNVPFVPPGAEVTVKPFKETYQYYPFVTTSSSVREFSVGLPEKVSESYTFHLKQNITYRDCRHGNRAATPETLQINMERVFVMYVKEERILRYAITNKISPVATDSSEVELLNPCYAGNHDCDTTAQCIPLEGQAFRCQCATGYRGDGQNCYDIDECAEGLSSCGDYSQCLNLPGTHRCQCQSGFELSYESRTCVALKPKYFKCNEGGMTNERTGLVYEMHRGPTSFIITCACLVYFTLLSVIFSDIDECSSSPCHISARCVNAQGSFQCQCLPGFHGDGFLCSPQADPLDQSERLKTPCEHHKERVQASSSREYPVAGAYVPQCDADGQYIPLQCHGSTGHCWCVDSSGQERAGTRTAPGATPADCRKPAPTSRAESVCERWRASLIEHYGGNPDPHQYLPQCEPDGEFSPVQCYGESTYCWCVDQEGREVPGTRSQDAVKPACLPSVAPPIVRPVTRPDVTPPAKTAVTLLYAQGQKIGALPLNGSRLDAERSKTLLTLHGSIVVGIAYDCKENKVYWTDLSARTINRASMASGAEPEMLINTKLVSPEGLALDAKRRLMFWVDSNTDVIESASLDGSRRRTLFDSDLVNPRAIVVVSSTGSLFWTDWNREAPKIETSTVDGQGRRVVVSDGIGLPNALTYDLSSGQICWADAGTKRLECISPNGSGRRVINSDLNYPFSMVYHSNHFYFSDWRRDGVIAVDKDSSKFTDEYLPEQRSHLYGITIATTHCLPGSL